MKLTVHVTADHIKSGRREDCTHCPVGRALHPLIHRSFFFSTVADRVIVRDLEKPNAKMTGVMFPDNIVEWIAAFDRGETVKPISFDITLPTLTAPAPAHKPEPEPEPLDFGDFDDPAPAPEPAPIEIGEAIGVLDLF